MAQKRCIAKQIARSDDFLDLPISSQALYFHLVLEADDRGYVNNPKSVIKLCGATDKDLDKLTESKFILKRLGNKVILIKGWKIHNQIQPSKLIETTYVEDFEKLYYDENGSYTEQVTNTPTNCRQKSAQYNTKQNNTKQDKLNQKNKKNSKQGIDDSELPDIDDPDVNDDDLPF